MSICLLDNFHLLKTSLRRLVGLLELGVYAVARPLPTQHNTTQKHEWVSNPRSQCSSFQDPHI
jgi:hypothetical protein